MGSEASSARLAAFAFLRRQQSLNQPRIDATVGPDRHCYLCGRILLADARIHSFIRPIGPKRLQSDLGNIACLSTDKLLLACVGILDYSGLDFIPSVPWVALLRRR